MADELAHLEVGWWITNTDLSGIGAAVNGQFKFVKMDASQQIGLCTVLGEFSWGVLQNKPKLGVSASLRFHGITKIKANAAIAVGAILTTAADGTAITAVATNEGLGVALTPAGGAGDIITAYLEHLGKR